LSTILKIAKRELTSYFTTPIGYVFIIAFVFFQMFIVIELNEFFEKNRADMSDFFDLLPFVFLIFIPAIGMRLWSEERRTGTIEILLTLPISITEAVIGKFLAAWVFVGISLLTTLSLVFTVMHLGSPDMGVITANYIAAFLIGGAYLSIASFCSALTKNQIVSLIISVLICMAFLFLGHKSFLNFAKDISFFKGLGLFGFTSEDLINFFSSFSFWKYQINIKRGILDSRDITFFLIFIATTIFLNIKLINRNKAK
jgi:ABC-2 type transport system permease protein